VIAFDPGQYSIDRAIGLRWNGPAGVAALAIGVLAAVLVTMTMRRVPAPTSEQRGSEERRSAA
jgi:hypothetical protein